MKINEVLTEVSMRPSTLKTFATSDAAAGIRAGFEAELCFKGKLDTSYRGGESEPDYNQDDRVGDIADIIDFFDDGGHNSSRAISRLREELESEFNEWQIEQISDEWLSERQDIIRDHFVNNGFSTDDRALELMVDAGYSPEDAEKNQRQDTEEFQKFKSQAEQELEDRVEESIDMEDSDYEELRDEFEEEKRDEYSEIDWLRDNGIRYASDVSNNYDIEWPHWTSGYDDSDNDNFNEESASQLVGGLGNAIGNEFDIEVSTGYGDADRTDNKWIIEPDGSITPDDSDDLAVEIISPPMDLNVCLQKLDSFAAWAKKEGAYSNDSTGFHVGVSLPEKGGQVDYIKLAMFLGDTYILEQFGRASNSYTKKVEIEIEKKLKNNPNSSTQQVITNVMQHMYKGLMSLASSLILSKNSDRYVTINMKSDYVEFRAMGGSDYLNNLDQTKNTIMRYAYAMNIAGDPEMYKREYAKKLYKTLNPEGRNPNTRIDLAQLIAEYTAGTLDRNKLSSLLQTRRGSKTEVEPTNSPGTWTVRNKLSGNLSGQFVAPSLEAALTKFYGAMTRGNHNVDDYQLEDSKGTVVQTSSQVHQQERWGRWIIYNSANQVVGAISARNQDEADFYTANYIRNLGGNPAEFEVRLDPNL